MSLDLTDDKSTMVQVMAWCRQATSHYLSQCWPRFMAPYGVTRPQWVNDMICCIPTWIVWFHQTSSTASQRCHDTPWHRTHSLRQKYKQIKYFSHRLQEMWPLLATDIHITVLQTHDDIKKLEIAQSFPKPSRVCLVFIPNDFGSPNCSISQVARAIVLMSIRHWFYMNVSDWCLIV